MNKYVINRRFALSGGLWLLFIVGLSIAKSAGLLQPVWGGIEIFLGGNRRMHFVMAAVLSLLMLLSVSGSLRTVLFWGLMLGCAMDEVLQYFLPLRHFNPLDFVATAAGLSVGWLVCGCFSAGKSG